MMRRFREDERGVSAVIGSILVAAMVASVFAHVQLYHVPVWEARAEERHAREIESSLADFHGSLVGPGGATAGASAMIPLRPDDTGLGSARPSTHRTTFDQSTAPLRLEIDTFRRASPGFQNISSAWDETWIDIEPGVQITEIQDILNLRMRVEKIGGPNGPTGDVRAIARDASGAYIGNFSIIGMFEGSDASVFIETTDGQEVIHYDNPVAVHRSNPILDYFSDLLNREYRYVGLLATAQKPLTLEFEENGLTARYAITYVTTGSDGSEEIVGGVGAPEFVDRRLDGGGRLIHHADRIHLTPQTYIMEHGATILSQPDGAVFKIPPALQVENRSGTPHISLALPVLTGDAGGIGGTPTASLDARPIGGELWDGISARIALNLTTDHPDLWADHFTAKLVAAGAPASNHTILTGDDWVRIEIGGPAVDPQAGDLSLNVRLAKFRLSIGG